MTNEKDNERKQVPIEQFRIVLTHEYFDQKGKRYMLDEPLVISCMNMVSNRASVALTLNEMMDKLKFELLKRYVGDEDDD